MRWGRYVTVLALALCSAIFAADSVAPLSTYTSVERHHWAFRPRAHPEVPQFSDAADRQWAAAPIDAFILARLKKEALNPSASADRATLIRRVYFDLTGLPPGPADVAAFLADRSPDAWEKLVEHLLASPHYGELGPALARRRPLL